MVKVKNDLEEKVEKIDIGYDVDKFDDLIKEKVEEQVDNAVRKAERKLMKQKNLSILKRDFIIIILIFFYVLLGYNLYNTNYFDKFINKYLVNKNNDQTVEVQSESSNSSEESKLSKEEVFEKNKTFFTSILKNYSLLDKGSYLEQYYDGKLSNEIKEEMIFNALNKDNFEKNGKLFIVNSEKVKELGNNMFSEFDLSSFKYNGINANYLKDDNMFLLTNVNLNGNMISREIVDINTTDSVEITCVEYIIINNKLYNPVSLKEIEAYKKGDNISKYKNDLITMKYTLEKNDNDSYKLKDITKENND